MIRPLTSPFLSAAAVKSIVAAMTIGATLTLSSGARADANYQGAVAAYVKVDRSNIPCGNCHDNPNGGGNRGRPFYFTLIDHGFKVGEVETIAVALEKVEQGQVDTDGDQAVDVAELAAGTSPNDASSKPASTGAGGSGGSGGGASGQGGAPPRPPAQPPQNAGGRGGSSTKPEVKPNDNEDTETKNESDAIDGTEASCSYGGGGASNGLALVAGLGLLSAAFARRKRRP